MEKLLNELTSIQKAQLELYSHYIANAKDWRTITEAEISMDAYLTALMHIGQLSYSQIQRIQAYYRAEDRSDINE